MYLCGCVSKYLYVCNCTCVYISGMFPVSNKNIFYLACFLLKKFHIELLIMIKNVSLQRIILYITRYVIDMSVQLMNRYVKSTYN